MFKGNQSHNKIEIVLYMLLLLLIDRRLEPNYIMEKFNISNITLVRYVATIKNMLCEFGIYYVDIYFDRTYNIYRCFINE